ncbi:MAG: GNAT family N-acetyltransferase, partial [Solirubrobacteraceae bacterium]
MVGEYAGRRSRRVVRGAARVNIRPLTNDDIERLQQLAREAEAEGFRFVTRFLGDVAEHRAILNSEREAFLGAVEDGVLVGFGGVTSDPYIDEPNTGRVRHLYVAPAARRHGLGRALVRALEARARLVYRRLRLRTHTDAAARFYEQIGYAVTG